MVDEENKSGGNERDDGNVTRGRGRNASDGGGKGGGPGGLAARKWRKW